VEIARVEETGYYLNRSIPAIALILKGVRLPAGTWTRVADDGVPAWHVHDIVERLHPELKRAAIRYASLSSDREVADFEQAFVP